MVIVYRNIYRQRCRLVVYFRFSCLNFDDHFEDQNFTTKHFCCVCIENRAILTFYESLNQNELLINEP